MLEMLKLKTNGNLTNVEEQYLSEMINQLKLDFTKASDDENNADAEKTDSNKSED